MTKVKQTAADRPGALATCLFMHALKRIASYNANRDREDIIHNDPWPVTGTEVDVWRRAEEQLRIREQREAEEKAWLREQVQITREERREAEEKARRATKPPKEGA